MNTDPVARGLNSGDRPTAGRRMLLVGVDPALVDFRTMPHLDASRVRGAAPVVDAELAELGFTVQRCTLDLGATALSVLEKALTAGTFDCVLIGAGLRAVPANLLLFEQVINVIHRLAPDAVVSFNSEPLDTVDAARRALTMMTA